MDNIKAQANRNLRSDFNGYEGQRFAGKYTGFGDPSLQFTGGSSFVDEGKGGKTYSITVKNIGTSAVDRVLALHPGYLTDVADMKNASGEAAAAVVSDGEIISTADQQVTCSGKPKKIAQFKQFVNSNPTRFTGLRMLVNNSDQFEEDLFIEKLSPFSGMGSDTITPGSWKDSNQTDDKRVEIPLENFQIDDQTLIVFTLKAGREVTFTFSTGAILNPAAELQSKAQIARQGVVRSI